MIYNLVENESNMGIELPVDNFCKDLSAGIEEIRSAEASN